MRVLLVGLVLVAALAYGADILVTNAAESRVADEVEQSVGGQAVVDLRGWPVSLGLLRGRVDEAAINATSVPVRGASGVLPSLDVLLSGVRLPFGLSGDGALGADNGRYTARIDQAALAALVAQSGVPEIAQVQLAGDHLQVLVNGVAVDLTVAARDGALVVQPVNDFLAGLSGERVVPVQGLPAGTSLDEARIENGTLILGGPVDLTTLVTSPAPAPTP
jgi:hypothetical protein